MAAKFLTPLVVRIDSEDPRRPVSLVEQLRYETSWTYTITVPAEFRSDLASIPRLARPLIDRLDGRTAAAAVVHDWLYSTHAMPRWLADAIFAWARKAAGAGRCKRSVMWIAVRLGGWHGWKRDNWRRAVDQGQAAIARLSQRINQAPQTTGSGTPK